MIFNEIQHWAEKKQQEYKFDETITGSNPPLISKYLYFGEDLVGVGQDTSSRKAKIKCAKNALENLR